MIASRFLFFRNRNFSPVVVATRRVVAVVGEGAEALPHTHERLTRHVDQAGAHSVQGRVARPPHNTVPHSSEADSRRFGPGSPHYQCHCFFDQLVLLFCPVFSSFFDAVHVFAHKLGLARGTLAQARRPSASSQRCHAPLSRPQTAKVSCFDCPACKEHRNHAQHQQTSNNQPHS